MTEAEIFSQAGTAAQTLSEGVLALAQAAGDMQLPPPSDYEWYDLLRQKLLPQLGQDAWLVVAVVGGTNIGKSVTFNHLAGSQASAVSARASGTRQVMALVPERLADHRLLNSLFPDFEVRPREAAEDALADEPQHVLYWSTHADLPERLVLLDTPDVDSDAPMNWERADAVRRAADVLIAVLTQQKYNDAAVKTFFREAAQEGKLVVVVVNQCLLPDDETYWPEWVATFCQQTGVKPHCVFLAPADRQAAAELRLPFLQRPWPVDESRQSAPDDHGSVTSLRRQLSELQFHNVRLQTLTSALEFLVSRETGVPVYLHDIRVRRGEYQNAVESLASGATLHVRNWPAPPVSVVVRFVREWWKGQQDGWAKGINQAYDGVTRTVSWSFRKTMEYVSGPEQPWWEQYREQEWMTILNGMEEYFERFRRLSQEGPEVVRHQFADLTTGETRDRFLSRLGHEHAQCDFEALLIAAVDRQLQKFREESPDLFRTTARIHQATALVRPATSVALFAVGFGPAGEMVAPFLSDLAGGAVATAVGETLLEGAGRGAGRLQSWINDLAGSFCAERAQWLQNQLSEHLLGGLPGRLHSASAVTETEAFRQVEDSLQELTQVLARIHSADHVD